MKNTGTRYQNQKRKLLKGTILPGLMSGMAFGAFGAFCFTEVPVLGRSPASDFSVLELLGINPETFIYESPQGLKCVCLPDRPAPAATHSPIAAVPAGPAATGVLEREGAHPSVADEGPDSAASPDPQNELEANLEPSGGAIHATVPPTRPCERTTQFEGNGVLRSSRGLSREQQNSCLAELSGYKDSEGNSRSFYWKTDGTFSSVIFLNRPGKASQNSWGRTLQLFPRVESAPDIQFDSDGHVTIIMANRELMRFDAKGVPLSYTGGEISGRSDPLDPPAEGGVDLKISKSLVIDYGWKKGGMPVDLKTGKAVVRDSRGKSCSFKNTELLNYIALPNGKLSHTEFKFKTDEEFASFLRNKCPDVDAGSLRERPSAGTGIERLF